MKKQIVLEHRQALDEYDKARTLHQSCKSTNKCPKDADCVCERALTFKEKQKVYQEKCEALNKLNESALAINQAKAAAKVNERLNRRNEGRTEFTGNQIFEREELTLEKYTHHSVNESFTDIQIGIMYGIPISTLATMKRKNFENNKGVKSMKYTGKQVYERSALTVDKYNKHRNDGFSDIKIRTSYGFPKSSFDKWKSDNGLTKKAVATVGLKDTSPAKEKTKDNPSLPREIIKNAVEIKVEPELNLLDLANENIVLKQENEKLNEEIKDLLLKITENNESHSQSLTERYTEIADKNETIRLLSQDNIVLQKEIEGFRIALEQHQEELSKLINNRNQSDEDLTIAINKQFDQFEKYEMLLLGRTLQLLKDKHSA